MEPPFCGLLSSTTEDLVPKNDMKLLHWDGKKELIPAWDLGIRNEHLPAQKAVGQMSTCGYQGHTPLGTEQSLDLE